MIKTLKNLPENLLEYSNSGKLIVLDNPDVIYLLKDGDFNFFLSEFDDKKQATNRIYYGSLSSYGCTAFRGITSYDNSKLKLCAVANLNTIYLELPYEKFKSLAEPDKALISEQLTIFITHLIKTSVPDVEPFSKFPTESLLRFFTDNSRKLYDFFENFVFQQKAKSCEQYKLLESESALSHKKAISNVFRFFHVKNKYNFDVHENSLLGAITTLGKVQNLTFNISNLATNADDNIHLDSICKQSAIRKREITLEVDWHKKCGQPFLGKLLTGENVAVFNLDDENKWHWYDSSTAKINDVDTAFLENLTNKATIFYEPFPDKPITLKVLCNLAWKISREDVKRVFFLFLIIALLSSAVPIINSVIFSTVIPLADHILLMQICILAVGFALTKAIIEYLSSLLLLRIRNRLSYTLQACVWDRLLSAPLSLFKDYSIGDMTSRSLGIIQLSNTLNSTFLKTFMTSILIFPALVLMFYYSPLFSAVMLLFILIMSCCFIIAAFVGYKLQTEMSALVGEMQGDIVQYFAGLSKIRATGTENQTLEHWSEKFSIQKKIYFKLSNCEKIISLLSSAIPIFTIIILIALSTFLFRYYPDNMITLSDFVAFSSALGIVSASFSSILMALIDAVAAIPLYQRLRPLLETMPEKNQWQGQIDDLKGNIDIKHVTFKYNTQQRTIVDNVSLKVNAGEFVAIVGESGSGKSTLLRLLLGFEKPLQGSISYDNLDLNQVNLRQLRSQIGVVLQDSKLIPDSIYKNIVAGSTSLSIDDAWQAAKKAGCHKDIEAMPMTMHTLVSGADGGLSGGQKQRILIARALVKNPKIIFFDEATSALDNNSQNIVRETISKLNITKILIAHRLSTVVDADRIVVLSGGKIIEQGTYEELLKANNLFAHLAKRQLIL